METAIEARLREAEGRNRTYEGMLAAAAVLREAGIPASSPETHALFHELIRLPDQATMKLHLREAQAAAATPTRKRKTYAAGARAVMAKDGRAMPDGQVAIKDAQDVEDAVDDWGRTETSDPAVKAHIIQAAKKVGATDALPADWEGSTKKLQESAAGLRQMGIPTIDSKGVAQHVRLREARSADELAQHGVPILSDSPAVGRQQAPDLAALGIPMLPATPGTSALHRAKLTESVSGRVIRRIS
jgi:hypothetical protein